MHVNSVLCSCPLFCLQLAKRGRLHRDVASQVCLLNVYIL